MRSESNLRSRTDNPQSNNNKQEGPSDSNYTRIKAQDKTRTEHIRTRTQSLWRKERIQELTDLRDYFRSLSEDSTPDRASPMLLLLNQNLYKGRRTSTVWCLEFHQQGVFIRIQWGVTDLIKSVTCQVLAGRPPSPACTNFKLWIPYYRLLESGTWRKPMRGCKVGPTGHPLGPLVSGLCTLPPHVRCIPVVTLILVEFQFSL
jgi:hypothetical protein